MKNKFLFIILIILSFSCSKSEKKNLNIMIQKIIELLMKKQIGLKATKMRFS